jgi:outer membrane protein assembly factor BamB
MQSFDVGSAACYRDGSGPLMSTSRSPVEESQVASRVASVWFSIVASLAIGVACANLSAQTSPTSRPAFPTGVVSASGITHTLLLHSPVQGKVYKIAGNGDIAGEYTVGAKGEDSWLLPDGRLLASHNGGVREIDPATGAITWEYKAKSGVEVHSCQPLSDHRVLICECGSKRLFEINRDLTIAHEIQLESTQVTHKQFRLARKTEAGTYLVAYGSDAVVRELDSDGKTLKTFVLPPRKNAGANGGFRLPNGNTLVTGGYGAEVYEFDHDAHIVWTLTQADLPAGFNLHYLGTAQRLANGNIVLSNFQGEPAVFEITPEKRVVWQYHNDKIGPISACMVLDEN